MIKAIKAVILLLFCLGLTSCSTKNMYQEPTGNLSEVAVLNGGSEREGFFDWEDVSVSSIDNKGVASFFDGGINISPGQHAVTLFAQHEKDWGGHCPCETFIDVQANFAAGRSYVAKMKVSGAQVEAWIEEEGTRKIISNKGIGSYRTSPPQPMPMIIYSPYYPYYY